MNLRRWPENIITYIKQSLKDERKLEIQIKYFLQILSLCKSKGIEAFVLMMPVRDNELKNYTDEQIIDFKNFIESSLSDYGFTDHYIDMSNHPDYKDYRKYTDITHLNPESADEFTKCFYKELNKNNNI